MHKHYFHICNTTTSKTSGYKNIISINELLEIEDVDKSVYLIHIHLNWDGNKLSNNYGFHIANLIRTEKKSKAPIIFYSPIQKEYFEEKSKKEIKHKILFGRGSGFIESPFSQEALTELSESIEPLSNAALHDVATMLCDLKGIVIDKLNHDLKYDKHIDKAVESVSPYLSPLQKQLIGLDKFVAEIKEAVRDKNQKVFDNIKLQFIALCNQELTEKGKDKPKVESTRHKVLVIDDVQTELDKALLYLKDLFTVEVTTSSDAAIALLKKDVKNEIVAVISDWRLFTDLNQNYWQPLQGYEVLDFAAKNGIRSLFAITSQADFVVHHLRNVMGIRFSLFKKENLDTEDQWKVFGDVLIEACEQAFYLRKSIPTAVGWTKTTNTARGVTFKSLQQQYTERWNSDERDTYWGSIEEKCNEIWNWLEGEKTNKYKDVYTLKVKYDLSLSSDEPLLFPVLVLRRIWMALWYSRNDSKIISKEGVTAMKEFCFEVMFTGMSKEYNKSAPGADMNKLCLTVSEICARKMLPEEKDWFIKQNLIATE